LLPESQRTFLISNLFYKEDEKSLKEKFKKYGKIVSVNLDKNEENYATGNGKIVFEHFSPKILHEDIYSFSKIIDVKREKSLKKGAVCETRLFISNIRKTLNKQDITDLLLDNEIKAKINLKAGEKNRNPGFCFLQFKNKTDVDSFKEKIPDLKAILGNFTVQKSIDKYA